ncbi:hypothetical protein KGQ71_01690 [Patescibacteria group bacterium]|nr:hypothetical protein [Patescibacteria group bacterium]
MADNVQIETVPSIQVREMWERQQPIFARIYREGIAAVVQSMPDAAKLFRSSTCIIKCIDEGVPGDGLHMAGSGILRSSEAVRDMVQKANAEGVTSHTGCGAAQLLFTETYGHAPTPGELDAFAEEKARAIAGLCGIPYTGQIGVLSRPPELHIARIVYYVSSADFDHTVGNILPPGFTVSRRYMGLEDALDETALGVNIAFGHHGFGDLISADAPFVLCAVGDPTDPNLGEDQLRKELKAVQEQFPQGRVIIDGFNAPPPVS